MKPIYILTTQVYNGTVVTDTKSAAFATKEVAEQTKEKLTKLTKMEQAPGWRVVYTIQESKLFETAEEVPALNGELDKEIAKCNKVLASLD